MHLAPTASKRIYHQRVGRVTRSHPGKEAGLVVDFVHPATKHDDPVVTLHSLLDRDVYRGGAIVVGPVRRGRGRRVRVERRVLPVTPDPERRAEVFERELWRIAVEHLDYGEQHVWAALAGARVAPNGWRRAKAMLHFDRGGELKRRFLLTALQRNRHAQLRLRALQEIASGKAEDGTPLTPEARRLDEDDLRSFASFVEEATTRIAAQVGTDTTFMRRVPALMGQAGLAQIGLRGATLIVGDGSEDAGRKLFYIKKIGTGPDLTIRLVTRGTWDERIERKTHLGFTIWILRNGKPHPLHADEVNEAVHKCLRPDS